METKEYEFSEGYKTVIYDIEDFPPPSFFKPSVGEQETGLTQIDKIIATIRYSHKQGEPSFEEKLQGKRNPWDEKGNYAVIINRDPDNFSEETIGYNGEIQPPEPPQTAKAGWPIGKFVTRENLKELEKDGGYIAWYVWVKDMTDPEFGPQIMEAYWKYTDVSALYRVDYEKNDKGETIETRRHICGPLNPAAGAKGLVPHAFLAEEARRAKAAQQAKRNKDKNSKKGRLKGR